MEEDCIIVYKNVLTELLCNDIIKLYNNNKIETKFLIPKNNIDWLNIERQIYKQLLININNYKNALKFNDNLIIKLSNPLYTKSFIIDVFEKNNLCKINTSYNRYNVINFIYALNDSNLKIKFKNNYNVILSKGCLLLFPCFFEFEIDSTTITNEQYIISGQLCNENII